MASSSSTTTLVTWLLLALLCNHLCLAKLHENDRESEEDPVQPRKSRNSDSNAIPMPYGSNVPLIQGFWWGCPCDGNRCGCDNMGCGCTGGGWMSWGQQPIWACPCDPTCRCDGRVCGCSAPLDYGCPPNLGYCQCHPENAYCNIVVPPSGRRSEAGDEVDYVIN